MKQVMELATAALTTATVGRALIRCGRERAGMMMLALAHRALGVLWLLVLLARRWGAA